MADNVDYTIQCPACGKEMKKIFMPEQNVYLDVCSEGCGGIFFDIREFSMFDEQHEDISPLAKVFEGKNLIKVDENQQRICPLCGQKMVKNFATPKRKIQIDECYKCGAKFLDYAEIDKIRELYKNDEEKASDVIKQLYSSVGKELDDFDSKYNERMNNSSFLSKLIKIKYN